MIRLSEEQRAIIGCYSGTKEEVIAELRKAIPFIEDLELREMTSDYLVKIEEMGGDDFAGMSSEGMMGHSC